MHPQTISHLKNSSELEHKMIRPLRGNSGRRWLCKPELHLGKKHRQDHTHFGLREILAKAISGCPRKGMEAQALGVTARIGTSPTIRPIWTIEVEGVSITITFPSYVEGLLNIIFC